MKVLLLSKSDKSILEPVKNWVWQGMEQALSRVSRHCPGSVNESNLLVITSVEEYNAVSFRAFFNEDSDTYYVVIVPELNWVTPGFESGYEKALDLLGDKLGNKFFHLVFVSSLPREILRKLVGTDFQGLVDAFPHLTLSALSGSPLRKTYSRLHFELIRRTVVSSSGRLKLIAHSLAGLEKKAATEARLEIAHILDVLALPVYMEKYGKEEKLAEIRMNVEACVDKGDIKGALRLIEPFIAEVQTALEPSSQERKKAGYRVLIVEDDPVYRDALEKFFNRYFYRVVAFDDVQIRQALSQIYKSASAFDLIILDMMFCERGSKAWLPFNGLDLYKAIRSSDIRKGRKTAVRIITALPRNDLSHLTEQYLKNAAAPIVFTKGDGWEMLWGCLLDRMDDMIQECEENSKARQSLDAPKNGFFGEERSRVVFDNPQRLAEAIAYAESVDCNSDVKLDPGLPSTKNQNNPDYLLQYLPVIMAFRRLIIKFLVANPDFDYDKGNEKYNNYIRYYLSRSTNSQNKEIDFSTKDRFTSLGFSKKKGCTELELKPEDLFDEEKILLPQISDDYSSHFDGPVKTWVTKLIGSFGDMMEDENFDCSLQLEDIYDGTVMRSVFGHPEDVPVEAFKVFLEQSRRFVYDASRSMEDRDYVLMRFDDADLEDYPEVKQALEKTYPSVLELVNKIYQYHS